MYHSGYEYHPYAADHPYAAAGSPPAPAYGYSFQHQQQQQQPQHTHTTYWQPTPEERRYTSPPEPSPPTYRQPSPEPSPDVSPTASRRQHELPPPSLPSSIDFSKLVESYKYILDSVKPQDLSSLPIDKLWETASYSARLLGSEIERDKENIRQRERAEAAERAQLERERAEERERERRLHEEREQRRREAAEAEAVAAAEAEREAERQRAMSMAKVAKDQLQEAEAIAAAIVAAHTDENGITKLPQVCLGCDATSTPEWRRGPMGPRTLCNACGLVYAKLMKKRTKSPKVNSKDQPSDDSSVCDEEDEHP
ncbi:hypothetical protein CYLTODRAFT_420083 [Cylindrobasidium torrendii FP15055 ss-10]|uniref:GATA-type domain-containing protein n=1 Tax=Cylindrobasidium torrendii FP15055 ss-10 TaxID=1314674 RepID=A0A0D7BIQ0_9AGAR|nr:hypothetical protein CYLTODRAFT_420083 [Cylindrobasidium torrendii FP15055 ss-10]